MSQLLMLTSTPDALPPSALVMLSHALEVSATFPENLEQRDVDLVIVDAREDLTVAMELTQRARANCDVPILLLVTAGALAVLRREWGADDFVLDSAEPAEIEARIQLLLSSSHRASIITCGPVVIDEAAYTVSLNGAGIDLTYTEFELLKFLVTHPGRVLTREHLLTEVWGYDYFGGTRTVDVHIRRLRAKLGAEHENHITTVRNVGYRFSATR